MNKLCLRGPSYNMDEALRRAFERSREIDEQIEKDRRSLKNEVKVLMLGAGETGKSTFIKQMRIIHGNGFEDKERINFALRIHENIIDAAQVLVNSMEKLEITYKNPENLQHAETIRKFVLQDSRKIPEQIFEAILALWKDEGIQQCYLRRNEFQIADSAKYYMENLERIRKSDFVPDDQDILRIRISTLGVCEFEFMSKEKVKFRLIDVGGQRSQRRKWIHCFDDVTAIIFLMALSEYDQKLRENETDNRLVESMYLFQVILEYQWFMNTPIILFLNKIDLFEEKIQFSNLNKFFPEYDGSSQNVEEAKKFILKLFLDINTNKERKIYSHFTCATDTKNITFIFQSVKDTILKENLRGINVY